MAATTIDKLVRRATNAKIPLAEQLRHEEVFGDGITGEPRTLESVLADKVLRP
jgi:hypothetical protein